MCGNAMHTGKYKILKRVEHTRIFLFFERIFITQSQLFRIEVLSVYLLWSVGFLNLHNLTECVSEF